MIQGKPLHHDLRHFFTLRRHRHIAELLSEAFNILFLTCFIVFEVQQLVPSVGPYILGGIALLGGIIAPAWISIALRVEHDNTRIGKSLEAERAADADSSHGADGKKRVEGK